MSVATKNYLSAGGVKEEDLLYLSYPLVHEGTNNNGDEFTAEEMKASYKTLVGTVVDKDHNMSVDAICGKNYEAEYVTESGKGIINVDAYVYANLYPDLEIKILDGTINAVSMECFFARSEQVALRRRRLHDIQFIGSGLVRIPGDPQALINTDELAGETQSGLVTPGRTQADRRRFAAIAAAVIALQEVA
jgi:hypothetical protein